MGEPRALDAQHALGRRPQPWHGDGSATAVTAPVAAVRQLRQRTGDPRLRSLEAAADGDVGEAADRFGCPVADPFAEAQFGASLRRPRQGGEALAQRCVSGTQLALDGVEVERCADA